MLLLQEVLVVLLFALFQWMGRSTAQWGTIIGAVIIAQVLFFLLRAIRNRNL
jgi:hypothetical protein